MDDERSRWLWRRKGRGGYGGGKEELVMGEEKIGGYGREKGGEIFRGYNFK